MYHCNSSLFLSRKIRLELLLLAEMKSSKRVSHGEYNMRVACILRVLQVGVPHKRAKESFGWAWASPLHEYDAVSANRLSNLVSTTLTNEVCWP